MKRCTVAVWVVLLLACAVGFASADTEAVVSVDLPKLTLQEALTRVAEGSKLAVKASAEDARISVPAVSFKAVPLLAAVKNVCKLAGVPVVIDSTCITVRPVKTDEAFPVQENPIVPTIETRTVDTAPVASDRKHVSDDIPGVSITIHQSQTASSAQASPVSAQPDRQPTRAKQQRSRQPRQYRNRPTHLVTRQSIFVRGYRTKNGVYVKPHFRKPRVKRV